MGQPIFLSCKIMSLRESIDSRQSLETDEKIISAEYTSDEIIRIETDRETFSFNLKKGKFIDNDNWKKYFN